MENKSGLSYLHYLNLIFVIAKIWGEVDWSWGVVFIPIYIAVAISIFAELVKKFAENAKENKKYYE